MGSGSLPTNQAPPRRDTRQRQPRRSAPQRATTATCEFRPCRQYSGFPAESGFPQLTPTAPGGRLWGVVTSHSDAQGAHLETSMAWISWVSRISWLHSGVSRIVGLPWILRILGAELVAEARALKSRAGREDGSMTGQGSTQGSSVGGVCFKCLNPPERACTNCGRLICRDHGIVDGIAFCNSCLSAQKRTWLVILVAAVATAVAWLLYRAFQ